jgi:hypothetical protein
MSHSLFSLRNLSGPLSSQAAAQPHRISSMTMNGPDRTRSYLTFGALVGGLLAVVALMALVVLPALNGHASQAASPQATQAISIAFIGASPVPTGTLPATISNTATSLTTPGAPADPAAQASQQPAAIQPLAGGGVQLVLDAHEHAWVRVRVDGNVVYEGIPQIGPNSSWHGQNTVGIETGNAGAFDVILNNVRLGPPGAHNATLKVSWDATGKVVNN